jgi:hypothetical protein
LETPEAPKTLTLTTPVIVQGKTYTELTFRKAKGRDLKVLDRHKGAVAGSLALGALLAGVPPEAVDEMDAQDVSAMSKIVATLMGNEESASGE